MNAAIIFDMDGVISDTQKFHAEVESLLLKEFGIMITPDEITRNFAGVADDAMFKQIFTANKICNNPPIDKIVMKKWDIMTDISRGRITAIPFAIELIQSLSGAGFKLAIASASTNEFIKEVLSELKLEKYFDANVSAQEVEHGKPAPDVFLLAAERLGVDPSESVVIEDGRSGMIGAAAAGMKVVGLVDDIRADYPANLLVSSLGDLTAQRLRCL